MNATTIAPRRTAHADCTHPATKADRAKCRRGVFTQREATPAAASITTPNGTVIGLGDIVTLTDSKVQREVIAITDGATITARRTDGGTRQVEVTTDKLRGVRRVA